MTTSSTKVKALCVATRCTSIDELVATFHHFCDDETFFVATLATRPVGLETPFAIQLADRTPALRGLCVVTDAWTTPLNPYRRPGIRLRIVKLTRDSTDVYARLRARRAQSITEAAPPPRPPRFETAGSAPRPFDDDAAASLPDGGDREVAFAKPSPAPERPRRARPMTPPITPEISPSASGEIEQRTEVVSPAPAPAPEPQETYLAVPRRATARSSPVGLPPVPPLGARPAEPPPVPPLGARPAEPATSRSELPPVPPLGARPAEPAPPSASELPPVPPRVASPVPRVVDARDTERSETAAAAPPPAAAPSPPAGEPSEARTPGSSFVLPANPLMNLTDESLEGFIDCTLYEATALFPVEEMTPPPGPRPSPAHPAVQAVQAADPVVPYAAYPPATVPPQTRTQAAQSAAPVAPHAAYPTAMPPPTQAHAEPVAPYAANDALAAQAAQPTDPVVPRASPPAPMPVVTPSSPPSMPPLAHPPAATGSMAPFPAYGLPAAAKLVMPPRSIEAPAWSRRRWAIAGGASVAAIAIAIVIAQSTDSTASSEAEPQAAAAPLVNEPEPADEASTPARVANVAKPAREPEPAKPPARVAKQPARDPEPAKPRGDATQLAGSVAAAADAPPPPAPALADGTPIVGKGPCRVSVVTTPAGSRIQVDDQTIGPAPLAFDGPCERRKVEISHARYAPATRWVTPTAGESETLDVTLVRPTHSLKVTTIPPGATITINGRRAGTSPTVVRIMGFQGVRVGASKSGYRTVTRRVYSKRARDRITLTMPSTAFKRKRR